MPGGATLLKGTWSQTNGLPRKPIRSRSGNRSGVGAGLLCLPDFANKAGNRFRWLCPVANPMVDPRKIQFVIWSRARHRVVGAERFDEAAVPARTRVRDDESEKRTVFRTFAFESESYCHGV